jgi:hypothetical protein
MVPIGSEHLVSPISALEAHELGPVEGERPGGDALARQVPRPLDAVRRSHQDLLRHAAAQRARATERLPIDDGDAPASLTAPRGHGRGDSGADRDETVLPVHRGSAAAELDPAGAPPAPHLAHVVPLVGPARNREPVHDGVLVGGIAKRPGRQAPQPLYELGVRARHAPEQRGQPVPPRARDRARIEPVGIGHTLEPDDAVASPPRDEPEAPQGLLVAAQQVSEHILDGPLVLRAGSQNLRLGKPGDQDQGGVAHCEHPADRMTAPGGGRGGASGGHDTPTVAASFGGVKSGPRARRPGQAAGRERAPALASLCAAGDYSPLLAPEGRRRIAPSRRAGEHHSVRGACTHGAEGADLGIGRAERAIQRSQRYAQPRPVEDGRRHQVGDGVDSPSLLTAELCALEQCPELAIGEELWQRAPGRPASEDGRLRHRDGGHEGGDRRRRVLVLAILQPR